MSAHYYGARRGLSQEVDLKDTTSMFDVREDPVGAFRTIFESKDKPDRFLLQNVINISADEPRIWHAGAASLYIRYILDGYEVNQPGPDVDPSCTPPPLWLDPLMGLTNIVAGIHDKQSAEQDFAILDECRSSYHRICAVIWRDLNRLLPSGIEADSLRRFVAQYIYCMAFLADYKEHMYDDMTLALMMYCWLNMSVEREQRMCAVCLVHKLLSNAGPDSVTRAPVLDRAVQAVGVETIIVRVANILSDPKLLDDALEDELESLGIFVHSRRPWSSAFVKAKIYEPVIQALLRQLKMGSTQCTSNVFHSAATSLLDIPLTGRGVEFMGIMTDMIQNTSFLEVIGQGLIYAQLSNSDLWVYSVGRMTHALQCSDLRCDLHTTPPYIDACRSKLETVYLLTLHELKQQGDMALKARCAWEEFGAAVGISENQLLSKWKQEKSCSFPLCTKRASTMKRPMNKCMRCEAVYYHDRACQRGDRKRHASECRPNT